MAGFLTPLELEFLDGHLWKVTTPFEYCVGSEDSNVKVVVPSGFFTDFASIPRGLWNILPPTGPWGKAAVVHDFLYQFPFIPMELSRKDCDLIFNEAMTVLKVTEWKRKVMYAGVRVGGWYTWNRYRKEGK